MTQLITSNITGIIIKIYKNNCIKYLTFWKDNSNNDWEIEYFTSNNNNHLCEKRGVFQECNTCKYYDPKYDCNFIAYKLPYEIIELIISRALSYNNDNTEIWYTLENPNLLRYWEIDTILKYAQPLLL